LGKKKAVPIVDAVIAYDCDISGQTHLMVVYNALYIPEMKFHLIPPFVMRLSGLLVDECPKFLARNASITNHSIFFPDHDIRIPLHLRGIVSYFPCRRPTREELNDSSLLTLNLTPDTPEWNPHNEAYSALEAAMVDYKGEIRERDDKVTQYLLPVYTSEIDAILRRVSRCLDAGSFASDLFVVASVGQYDLRRNERFLSGVSSSLKRGRVDAEELSKLWNIGLEAARRTLDTCTQLVVRSNENPTLNKRFSSNDRMLRYNNNNNNSLIIGLLVIIKLCRSLYTRLVQGNKNRPDQTRVCTSRLHLGV
jgi:hypothetical protein